MLPWSGSKYLGGRDLMLRSAVGKVMWVGRATVFLVGLAVIVALVLGVATMALGATGGNFILGKANAAGAVSRLTANIAGPALNLVNTSTGTGATALNLQVAPTKPPLKVNSSQRVANLNADRLDGMNPRELPGTIASTATIHSFPGIPFDLGTSAAGWKFVGNPAPDIPTRSSSRLVGAAAVPLGDPTATAINYDLCYRPSGGGTITPFTGGSSATLTPNEVVYTATSSAAPGAGTWDVGFCIKSAVNDSRDAERVSYVNGWVMVVEE
jgi:hypothetical protein